MARTDAPYRILQSTHDPAAGRRMQNNHALFDSPTPATWRAAANPPPAVQLHACMRTRDRPVQVVQN
jgi:hypothetical protein